MAAPDIPNFTFDGEDFNRTSDERVVLIEKLLSIGSILSSSQNLDEVLTLILSKSREITCSDAGSVYLINRSDAVPKLIFKVAQNDSLSTASFREFAVPLTPKSLAGYVALTGQTLNIPDAHQLNPNLPYQLDRNFDRDFSYRTRSVLVLPMQDMEGEVIGVLQLINRKIRASEKITAQNAIEATQPYSEWEERILRSLASQAAISIERNYLQESIENLFEGFVLASVKVIENRDPTTSGHSERVAALTVQLSEEVNLVSKGPLSLIQFDERQLQEIRYASLLHDFGKIGVPESILNKQKKLYPDTLNVVRQRFAVVQRTLEMECAQKKFQHLVEHPHHRHKAGTDESCPHCQHLEILDHQLAQAIKKLQEYWELIKIFNEPEAVPTKQFHALSEDIFYELKDLHQYTYRDVDGKLKPLITSEEMEQLMLPRGNLTPEERYAIEAHVTHSFEFLRRIPWTKHLQNIPIIAYGHHEKLDGSGYPRGIKGSEIPIQTQMMTITDIYDALTAADRPYKKALGMDIVLKILREEADKNKINPNLVQLFEQREVYQVLGHTLS